MESAAIGFRVKSGYAVAVAVTGRAESPAALLRHRVELSDPAVVETRQPFHAAFGTAQEDPAIIERLVKIIEGCAKRSLAALLDAGELAAHQVRGSCLVVGSTIDPAAVANPHIRAHASEGRLFRSVVEQTLASRGIECSVIVEKQLAAEASSRLKRPKPDITRTLVEFGRNLGAPWRTDEKAAALAAWLALL